VTQVLRVLLVEDSDDDAILVSRELRRGGFALDLERVDAPDAMLAALDRQTWDVVIVDYALPRFSGLGALALLRERRIDIPTIIISGVAGEETAITAMQAGAHDYVIKGNWARLIPAIERELVEARNRRDRRRAEEQLAASYRQTVEILESMTDAFYSVDHEWRITYVNHRAEQIWGVRRDDVLGRSLWDVLPHLVGTRGHEELLRAAAERSAVDYEIWSPRFGAWFDVRAFATESGISVYFRNVSQRKRVEDERERLLARERAMAQIAQALVHEREFGRVVDVVIDQSVTVLEAEVVGLWLADPIRRQLNLLAQRNFSTEMLAEARNLSFDSMFLAAASARTDKIVVVDDAWESDLPPAARQFYARQGVRAILGIPLRSQRRLVGVLTYGSRQPGRFSERDRGFFATIGDLFAVAVENAWLNDEVRQALRIREEFVAAAAHELKTPITVIKGRAQWLQKIAPHDPQVEQALQAIDQYVDRMTHLVDDLLAVIQVRPNFIAPRRQRFDMVALASDLVTRTGSSMPLHRIHFDAEGDVVVDADRQLIGEVISRLIENAIRYSPDGGTIEVVVRRQNDDAVVSVTDHGVGIARERQPHAFEPFYELIPHGEPGYVGIISLGLYLSKQIIDAHGGHIWVKSELGRGSTFAFDLPLA